MISKELFKGSLRSLVLKLLSEYSRMYGYEITRKVEDMSQGRIKLTFGALYPILHKLETDGVVVTETEIIGGRARIYYKLTTSGKSFAAEKISEIQEYLEMMGVIFKPGLNLQICKP